MLSAAIRNKIKQNKIKVYMHWSDGTFEEDDDNNNLSRENNGLQVRIYPGNGTTAGVKVMIAVLLSPILECCRCWYKQQHCQLEGNLGQG